MSKLSGVLTTVAILLVATLYLCFTVYIMFIDVGNGRYYNCTHSEISPDFPPEVREACRKARVP